MERTTTRPAADLRLLVGGVAAWLTVAATLGLPASAAAGAGVAAPIAAAGAAPSPRAPAAPVPPVRGPAGAVVAARATELAGRAVVGHDHRRAAEPVEALRVAHAEHVHGAARRRVVRGHL